MRGSAVRVVVLGLILVSCGRAADTASAPTPTAPAPLPVPVAPPPESGIRDQDIVLGRIEIPVLELDSELREGIRIPTLDNGPGHWPGSAMPGQMGNAVVAGHRTSNEAEFRHLDELVPGDEVIMTTPRGRFVYVVESIEIVGPDALWIITQTDEHRATLFACHPPGSVAERIVAHLRLTGT
jgi:sortase A